MTSRKKQAQSGIEPNKRLEQANLKMKGIGSALKPSH